MFTEIKFPTIEKINFVDSSDQVFENGDEVLVDLGQTQEVAVVISGGYSDVVDKNDIIPGLILRKTTQEDQEKIDKLKEKANEYLPLCQEKIEQYNLAEMKLLGADLSYDEKKLTFFFSAEGRIDFRELVTELVRTFKKIIRLQQIGSRDEAKIFGGCGKCGRNLCCSSFLNNVESVTLDMAKEQDIVSSSNKLSGLCGKLMCCLAFELENYRVLTKNMPQIGEEIKIKNEKGRVVSRSLIKQTYQVETEKGQKVEMEI